VLRRVEKELRIIKLWAKIKAEEVSEGITRKMLG